MGKAGMKDAFSIRELEKISGGQNEVLSRLLELFQKQLEKQTSDIKGYMEAKNWGLLKQEAHKIKSLFRMLEMQAAGKIAEQLELEAGIHLQTKEWVQHIETMQAECGREIERILSELGI